MQVKFSKDSWCGEPLLEKTCINTLEEHEIDPDMFIGDVWDNGKWYIPSTWQDLFPFVSQDQTHYNVPDVENDKVN